MATVKSYTWEILAKSTPLLKKKCNKCNSKRFYCSNKFRMNSQKKDVDVWLIYKCEKCDSTHNVTILSRTKIEKIEPELYQKFCMNDEDIAQQYAANPEFIRKNRMDLDYSNVVYDIVHEDISIDGIANMDVDVVECRIISQQNVGIKLSIIIRTCLGISLNQLERLINKGVVHFNPDVSWKKCKTTDGLSVYINCIRLRELMKNKQ